MWNLLGLGSRTSDWVIKMLWLAFASRTSSSKVLLSDDFFKEQNISNLCGTKTKIIIMGRSGSRGLWPDCFRRRDDFKSAHTLKKKRGGHTFKPFLVFGSRKLVVTGPELWWGPINRIHHVKDMFLPTFFESKLNFEPVLWIIEHVAQDSMQHWFRLAPSKNLRRRLIFLLTFKAPKVSG